MSLKFYKTPGAGRPWRPPVMEEDCRSYRRRAKRTNKWIPPRLGFEEVIRNKTESPCSLNDFMDYLVYVEQDAEPLQFFLWYCGYVHEWTTALTPEQRALAPRWDPDRGRKLSPRERRARNASKVSNILEMLDEESDHHQVDKAGGGQKRDVSSAARSSPSRATVVDEEKVLESKEDGGLQVIMGITTLPRRHGRRDEPLHHPERPAPPQPHQRRPQRRPRRDVRDDASIGPPPRLREVRVELAEALIRGKLHPDFIRHSMANTNRAATHLLRLLSLVLMVLGLGLDAALILSSFSRYYRLLSTPLLFLGLAVFVAALDGVSLRLHLSRRRHVRPWEVPDLEAGTGADKRHRRAATFASVAGAVDPLRKPSLQTMGPENVFSDEEWVAAYDRRRLWRRVFERTSGSRNPHLRILQDGVVAGAVLWAALATVGIGVGSIFIPSYNMF
ncbi:hypothetical protein CSHISOI_02222 [Colletotrichum shisoi]|uniref:RGS domain-containing protein n=1 Tax=Colletotrichum shisoi TaxID=2078593 RepID=A0A5Q4C2Z7_9PEZI|nr:hypothetical protein CSHISOI_02222 [Colletotrichum shisoi]